jgi:membrane protease YdiL (CAAX protease family)
MADASPRFPYYRDTRHPWPSLLFLLPLLGGYEIGVLALGGERASALRNGADAWFRWALEAFGVNAVLLAPVLVVVWFGYWSWRRRSEQPEDMFSTCVGMWFECFVYALGLWGVSHALGPVLDRAGIELNAPLAVDPMMSRLVTYIGAGIYEEVLFRLVLFAGLVWLLKVALFPKHTAVMVAVTASALMFAAAHHIGPYGEKVDLFVFLFRTLAGVYFAVLYHFRGFGIAAGAHAAYDVLVGLHPGSAG